MPNHVYNTLTVTGPIEALNAFKEKAKHNNEKFSYWNFKTPPQEAMDSGEYHATHGFAGGQQSGNTPNNWYNFNNREWGTKWDAYDLHVDSAPKAFYATFSSAWSPPLPVFEAMVEQHPELNFDFSWEEEQGWGGEAIGVRGDFSITNEWDIPNSHAEYVAVDRVDSCQCAYEEDEAEWYDDCPKSDSDYQEDN